MTESEANTRQREIRAAVAAHGYILDLLFLSIKTVDEKFCKVLEPHERATLRRFLDEWQTDTSICTETMHKIVAIDDPLERLPIAEELYDHVENATDWAHKVAKELAEITKKAVSR